MLLRLLMAKMSSQEWSNPREISVNCPGIESDISDGLVSTSLIKLRSAWSSTRVSPSFLSQAHQRHVTYRMCLTTWDWCPLRNISKRARIVTRRQQDTIFMDFRSLCFLRRRVSRASWEGWFEATALEMPAAGAQLLPIFWPFDWQYICVYNNISYIKHTFILFILFYITFIRFYTVSMCAYSEFVALLCPFFCDFAGSDDSWEVLAQLRASPPRRLEPPALAVSRIGFSMIFCLEPGFILQQTLHIPAPLWILNSGNASDKEGSAKKLVLGFRVLGF